MPFSFNFIKEIDCIPLLYADDIFVLAVSTISKILHPPPLVFWEQDLLLVEKRWSSWLSQHEFFMWMDTNVRYVLRYTMLYGGKINYCRLAAGCGFNFPV